jgi:hypothetical protein
MALKKAECEDRTQGGTPCCLSRNGVDPNRRKSAGLLVAARCGRECN